MYDINTFTYGYEIEWGDIDRTVVLPERLGTWEYAETDIVNMLPPYANIAVDPLGISPPMGGEINVKPTKTIDEMIERIAEIKTYFPNPTASCVNHGHVHIFVPGLKDDIKSLKKLISFIKLYQSRAVEICYGYYDDSKMKFTNGAKQYLKYDGGRLMPDYMCDNIIERASNFNEFIDQHCMGKDGVSRGRPFRYAINTYCMKHTGTIEFRFFRGSCDLERIRDSMEFCTLFLDFALNHQEQYLDMEEMLFRRKPWKFPVFLYDHENYDGWVKTKYSKERGKKVRTYYDV